MMDKLLTVKQVMTIIPMGKTTVTAIVKSLPHVTLNRKLMVRESAIAAWIDSHTRCPGEQAVTRKVPRKALSQDEQFLLDENGMIPTRKALQRMMEEREASKKRKRKGGAA